MTISLSDIVLLVHTFKSKAFSRWSRSERLDDARLCEAVREMEQGLWDANLGGHVYKKRLASAHRGKRGAYRTLLAYRQGQIAVFLYGFAKNERDNITPAEKEALKKLAKLYLEFTAEAWKKALTSGELIEVNCNEQEEPNP